MHLPTENKNKKWRALFLGVFFVVALAVFFDGNTNRAYAAETADSCKAKNMSFKAVDQSCGGCLSGYDYKDYVSPQLGCALKSETGYNAEYTTLRNADGTIAVGADGKAIAPGKGSTAEKEKYTYAPTCNTMDIGCQFKAMLYGIMQFCGWLSSIAATLFAFIIDPKIMSGNTGMLNFPAVKDVWVMVRDTLNIAFILVLLFAAFCTVFQVDSWNLKKVWLNILINALLVNFSFPIARIIIDISNVLFYYFANTLFTNVGAGAGTFASFQKFSNIADILVPQSFSKDASWAYYMAGIIFLFILGMTLLVIAGLFVVRLVALTMLVMFSPIGFIGYIFPDTKSYAKKWWNNLVSYSFFAPIMMFMIMVALKMMEASNSLQMQSMIKVSSKISSADAGLAQFIANAAFFFIPLIVLWMSIGVAKSFGVEGAAKVTGWADKIMKKPWSAAWKWSGIPGGTKAGWENVRKTGKIFGKENWATRLAFKAGRPEHEARTKGLLTGGAKGYRDAISDMKQEENREKIEKGAKSKVNEGASADTMITEVRDSFNKDRGKTDRGTYVKHATSAAAYLRQDSAERQYQVEQSLSSGGLAGLANSHTYDILSEDLSAQVTQGATRINYNTQKAAALAAARRMAANVGSARAKKADSQLVHNFMNKQMKLTMQRGAKAV